MIFESPLAISDHFWTPETYQKLEDRCCSYSGAERAIALTTMAYTMNMCAKAVNDEITRQQKEADEMSDEEFLDVMRNYS